MLHVMARRLRPARRVAVATLVFLAAFIAVAVASTLWSRQHLLTQAETIVMDSATLMRNQVARMLDVADAQLLFLRHAARTTNGDDPAAVAALEHTLQAAVRQTPYLFRFFLTNREGDVIASSMTAAPPLNTARRAYFGAHQRGVREPLLTTGVASQASGEPIMILSRRVDGPSGEFAGVALVSFNLAELHSFFRANAPKRYPANFQLLGADLRVLLDVTLSPDLQGQPLAPDVVALMQARPAGVDVYTAPDGTAQIWAHQQVDHYPLYIRVGTALDTVLAHWQSDAIAYGTAAATGLLGLLLLSVFIVTFARREEIAAQRLAAMNSELERRVRDRTAQLEHLTADLRAAVREKDVLLQEVHHRVKNNLQVIASMVRLSARSADDITTDQLVDAISRRVQAIALVHQTLYEAESPAEIDMGLYLGRLADLAREVYGIDERRLSIIVRAHGTLDLTHAMPVGLVASEVLANALKHAFPGRVGQVDIGFEQDDRACRLTVADNGVGLPHDHTAGTGLGIVAAIAGQLKAVTRLSGENGCRFEMAFRVARAEQAPEEPGAAGGGW